MLKFIKHNLDTISGIDIYPLISFVIFFVFFILTVIWVFRMSKETIAEVENLPLDHSAENELFHTKN